MLKTLKWVYDLGVRQERARIASHLRLEAQRAKISRDTTEDMLRESLSKSSKTSKSRREKLDFAIAVDNKVQEIIHNLFDEQGGHYVMGASLMFPDDKHKGEI